MYKAGNATERLYSALSIQVSISFLGIIVATPCAVFNHPLQAFCIVEGLVCPVIMEMLPLTSAD